MPQFTINAHTAKGKRETFTVTADTKESAAIKAHAKGWLVDSIADGQSHAPPSPPIDNAPTAPSRIDHEQVAAAIAHALRSDQVVDGLRRAIRPSISWGVFFGLLAFIFIPVLVVVGFIILMGGAVRIADFLK